LYGLSNYRNLQKKENWKKLYQYIYASTSGKAHPIAHEMSGLMLGSGLFQLLQLCWLCMKYRHIIYWNGNARGAKGLLRGFFYPFIFSYNNVQYDL
jgi:hypothetical protein